MALILYDAVPASSPQNPNVNGLAPAVLLNSRENVTAYPANKTIATSNDLGIMTGDYTVTASKPFTALKLDHEVSNLKRENMGAGFGPVKTTVDLFVRGTTDEILGFMNQCIYDELVVVVKMADGKRVPLGNTDFPARIKAEFDSKTVSASDPRGYKFTIESYSKYGEELEAASVVPIT